MRRLVPISLPILLCFCLKSSINVKSQNEKKYWAAKTVTHTSIWLRKRESDLYENVWCPKSQRFSHQIEISKILGIDLKMRCIDSKWSNDMMYMEPNEKLQSYVIKFCGRSIRLNLINHFVGFIPCQFACNSAFRNPVFRWESCKGNVWERVNKSLRLYTQQETRD